MDVDEEPEVIGIDLEIDKLAEKGEGPGLTEADEARLAALNDAKRDRQGLPVPRRREYEPGFAELAGRFLDLWATQYGLKASNTRPQKEATFRLFGGFIGDKPLRDVKRSEVADFMDELRRLNPNYGRSPKSQTMTWSEIIREHGGNAKGLSPQTMNRHIDTLSALWKWADQHELVDGRNPFAGFKQRIKAGVNQHPYLPWTAEELRTLFDPPPKRDDLTELMVAALHTGMRLDELASLTLGQIKQEDGIHFIDVRDAKTPAGDRAVPLHFRLRWMAELEGEPQDRVWPKFNPEGPGKKPGADAGRAFSAFKARKGFSDRTRVFHSFRKNVTQIMERAGVPENEWAQVLGHERNITYGLYNPEGITLLRKAQLIELIEYPGIDFPGR
ncbi:tyrosine-type recombinase/integrase [Aurantiacibacter sp. D1-12]|uniref:tyrosine-type recombinase/integrase n=1 Tax=Aurantiacibacter sp. D1-12 TaxID=2993658 RepID=UPI00237CF26A|nr:tyrosine-type recombinase/integrase [Aurantiacibacter sp. D1-12]MDE1467929.1 tyrosine-type recombinase/integrase [Aurantiacibacter sp. D1-12]